MHYNIFTSEDSNNIGAIFLAQCISNFDYEEELTIGKHYIIKIVERILPMSPLCEFVGNSGRTVTCHLRRFEKAYRTEKSLDTTKVRKSTP